MAKFSGKIGYAITTETKPGVWTKVITEKNHYGDVIKDMIQWRSTDKVNDDLVISNKISIVANSFAIENMGYMKYVLLNGTKWLITSVGDDRPRLTLTLGGVYNG